jgi:DNA-binding PadR family transcriptional regulator
MGRTAAPTFGLSATDAVLGLLIERPANSYQLEKRLAGRFGSAQFGHGTAYHAVKRLSKQGLIRAVDGDGSTVPPATGAERQSGTAYEATTAGGEHFARWRRASIQTPPVREELLAKIAFCAPADLPRLVAIVHEAELACAAQLEDLQNRIRTQQRLSDEHEWRRLIGMVVTIADAAWWNQRLKWLEKLGECLNREAQRHATASSSGRSLPQP